MKILMVCYGNICRSPLAEGVLQQKAFDAGLNWSVESAGTSGIQSGNAPHFFSQKIARLHNIDISCQKARKFTKEDMIVFDRIYAMSSDVFGDIKMIAKEAWNPSKVDLLLNEIWPAQNVDLPDPWYGPESGYHETYRLIDEACEKIILKYKSLSPAVGAAL